jgi:Trypsin-like peptidase domain
MSGAGPPVDAWVVAIHASEDDFPPLGTGVVIAERRVLTCAHVVRREGAVRSQLWVAFPKGDDPLAPRVPVAKVQVAEAAVADLAVLRLAVPVPAGVVAAPLRCPKPVDLVGRRWWAFGSAGGDPLAMSLMGPSAPRWVTAGLRLGCGWTPTRGITSSAVSAAVACGRPTTGPWSPW